MSRISLPQNLASAKSPEDQKRQLGELVKVLEDFLNRQINIVYRDNPNTAYPVFHKGDIVFDVTSGSYQLFEYNGSVLVPIGLVPKGGTTGQVLAKNTGTDYDTLWITVSGTGTVTSVGLAVPTDIFSVAGSPITVSGTITISKVNQTANFVYAGPTTGAAAAPTFRLLVAADIPNISESQVTNLVSDLAGKQPAFGNQAANTVYAGPTSGGAAAPAFRTLVAADIPNIAESQVTNLVTDLANRTLFANAFAIASLKL